MLDFFLVVTVELAFEFGLFLMLGSSVFVFL